jgi:hypothetical protein
METIPNTEGPRDPPGGVEVPDGDVREPPLPNDQRSEGFPGKNDSDGGIEKDA